MFLFRINPLNAELHPICHLLALLGAHHILHISRIRVNTEIFFFLRLVGLWVGSFQGLRLWRKHEPIATHLFLIYLFSVSLLYLLFTSFCPSPSFFLYFFVVFDFKLFLRVYLCIISCPICLCFFLPFFLSFSFPGWCFQNDCSVPANSRNVSSCRV